jgi:hypothetical protein
MENTTDASGERHPENYRFLSTYIISHRGVQNVYDNEFLPNGKSEKYGK